MDRSAIEQLEQWKNQPTHLPLLVIGARQVGKTWLVKHFGAQSFKNLAYLSFDSSPALAQTLESTVLPKELLPVLSAETGVPIKPGETLIVFDEIQDSPRALLSLKYFMEEAPEYHIIAAGSALGVMLHQQASFPVGKVEFLNLFPLSFNEFLGAIGESELAAYVQTAPLEGLRPFHDKLLRITREYLYVGGMPGVVSRYAANRGDYNLVRKLQNNILQAYDRDFSKYARPLFASKLRTVWQSLPNQLSKEKRRFTYAQIKESARGRDFAAAIQWLKDSSMATPVHTVTAPRHPLAFYVDNDVFKLFVHDIGLLSAMANLRPQAIALGNEIFQEFKGALAEQFVFQELACQLNEPFFYWSDAGSKASIDFLVQDSEGNGVPIEVKSGTHLSSRGLNAYQKRFAPTYSIRASLANYKHDSSNSIFDLPFYAVSRVHELLKL